MGAASLLGVNHPGSVARPPPLERTASWAICWAGSAGAGGEHRVFNRPSTSHPSSLRGLAALPSAPGTRFPPHQATETAPPLPPWRRDYSPSCLPARVALTRGPGGSHHLY